MTSPTPKIILVSLSLLWLSASQYPLASAQEYAPPSQKYNGGNQGRTYTEPGEYDYQKPNYGNRGYSQDTGRDSGRGKGQKSYNPYRPPAAPYTPPGDRQSNYGYYGIPDQSANGTTPSGTDGQSQNNGYPSPNYGNQSHQRPTDTSRQSRDYNDRDAARTQPGYRPAPDYDTAPPPPYRDKQEGYSQLYNDQEYSENEISEAGHRFFGKITKGLAKAIARAFKKSGRPNGYILGEEGGGAFIAGLRYGEGKLHTKSLGKHAIYWQGPSVGYDFGASGSKTMILVYNLKNIDFIYQNFGGVTGSAYIVGGVGLTLMKRDDVTLAPIRSGVGLRLGANIGYLKFTRRPTWNPF